MPRISSEGRVTIPARVREELGLKPGDEVEFEAEGSAARVTRATHPTGETRGQRLVRLAWGSATDRSMTTDEIMAMTRGEE